MNEPAGWPRRAPAPGDIAEVELQMIATNQARAAAAGTVHGPHCAGTLRNGNACRKLLALVVSAPWIIECPRCGYRNGSDS